MPRTFSEGIAMVSIPTRWSGRDHLDFDGATRLAESIKAYWAERGYAVETEIVSRPTRARPVYEITSDMVGGRPVKKLGAN